MREQSLRSTLYVRSGQIARFATSSMVSSMVDLSLFGLLRRLLLLPSGVLVPVASVLARCISGALNFMLNRRWSFAAVDDGSHKELSVQAKRYAILFLANMILSAAIVSSFARYNLRLPLEVIKAVVDIGIFCANFLIQRNWVYAKRER